MLTSPRNLARTGGRELHRIVYSERDIAERVRDISKAIDDRYAAGEPLMLLGLLKGSFIFVSDLARCLERPVRVEFLVAASYGDGTESTGKVEVLYDANVDLRDRHVIVVEDIVDSGTTLSQLMPMLEARGPRSLEVCALLHKNIAPELMYEPRWVGFNAPDEFLVGYGLDHADDFRNLPFIASLPS